METKGVELRWQDPRTKTYLGSPSIVRLPDGALLASHDYFGPGCPRNHENEEHLTSVYRSEDGGRSWVNLTHIANAYWSTLFVLDDAAYLLGVSQQYGSIVIRRSTDGGFTWTHPSDGARGLLFKGGPRYQRPNYHCAPTPVLVSNGRVFKAFEDCTPCVWGTGFQSLVISAPVGSDLLDHTSWTMTPKVPFNPEWLPWKGSTTPGWLEGNVAQGPDGRLVNVLRFNADPLSNKAAILGLTADGSALAVDPETMFIDMPGGCHKFTIRRDPRCGRYLTLSNHNINPAFPWQRNVLALCASIDLRQWHVCVTVLSDGPRTDEDDSVKRTGFQYVDWQFDGDDILMLVRVARHGAPNFHDSNRIVFWRIPDYSDLLVRERLP